MHAILKPRQARPDPPQTRQAVSPKQLTQSFLQQARQSALGHFDGDRVLFHSCLTVQCLVPGHPETGAATGTIIAHVSPLLLKAWMAAAPGSPTDRRAHVITQVHLVLKDLADRDIHVQLAMTDTQRDVYTADLVQSVAEGLARTTFGVVGRRATVHWEGTLVREMQPPFLVLVLSIGL